MYVTSIGGKYENNIICCFDKIKYTKLVVDSIMNQLGYFIYKTRFLWINCKMVQFSMSTSITQSCIWESCTKQNIDYPCNLLHAQETYNTIMSMHAFGYISRCSYSTTLLKYSCYIIFLVEKKLIYLQK